MSDGEFLRWLVDRLVLVYGESENVDFVHRLRKIAGEPNYGCKIGRVRLKALVIGAVQ